VNTKLYYLKGGEIGNPEFQAAFNELVAIAARGEHVVVQCGSETGLAKGELVYPVGVFVDHATYGSGLLVDKADASDSDKPAWGVMSEAVAAFAGFGVAYRTGVISGIDTSGAAMVGDIAYLSPDTPGAFTFVKPTAAGHIIQPVGAAVTDHAVTGQMYFSVGAFRTIGDLPANAVIGSAALANLRGGKITLNGVNPTRVQFKNDSPANKPSVNAEPFALANGSTLIVDPDGDGDDTVTFAAVAGTSVSGASPSTDISGETDSKFKIAVDGDTAEEVTLDVSGKNTGELIAAEMQTAIQALSGNKATVTVAFDSVYTITSGTAGTASAVVVTDAPSGNIAEELKMGEANGGTETAGTGDAANIAAATAAEVAAAITAKATGWHAEEIDNFPGYLAIFSDTDGKDSSLVVNAASTADTVLGITGSAYGAQGLGYDSNMADALYLVQATLDGVAQGNLAAKCLSVTSRSAAGFQVECETAAATHDVDLVIIGVAA